MLWRKQNKPKEDFRLTRNGNQLLSSFPSNHSTMGFPSRMCPTHKSNIIETSLLLVHASKIDMSQISLCCKRFEKNITLQSIDDQCVLYHWIWECPAGFKYSLTYIFLLFRFHQIITRNFFKNIYFTKVTNQEVNFDAK